jgi:hypothetical protein
LSEAVAVDPREKPRQEWTSADLHIAKYYWKLFKSKVYGKSVMDMIREAPDAEELKLFLESVWPGASSGTRRKWAKAAEIRYKQLWQDSDDDTPIGPVKVCVKPIA